MGTYSLPVRVARVRGEMVLVVSYEILIERVIYYPWGMHICDYDEKYKKNLTGLLPWDAYHASEKTLTRVGIEPTTFGLDVRRSTD